MCEADAYVIQDGREQLVMESLDKVEPIDDGLQLVSIFGEQKFIKGQVDSLSLVEHKVVIKLYSIG